MPVKTLTEEEKIKYLQSQGLNPAEYDVDEYTLEEWDGLNQPVEAPKPMGADDAFFTRFKRGLAPAAASIPGMIAGAKGGGALGSMLGPVGTAVGGVLGAVGGGLATGALGSVAQEPIWKAVQGEEDYNKGLAHYNQAMVDRSGFATLGDVASQGLTFGPGGLRAAATGAGKLAQGVLPKLLLPTEQIAPRLALAEKQALANVAVGAGMGGGMELGKQAIYEKGQPFDLGRAAIATAGGAILNEPWGLGRKLMPGMVNMGNKPSGDMVEPQVPPPVTPKPSGQPPVPVESLIPPLSGEAPVIPPVVKQPTQPLVQPELPLTSETALPPIEVPSGVTTPVKPRQYSVPPVVEQTPVVTAKPAPVASPVDYANLPPDYEFPIEGGDSIAPKSNDHLTEIKAWEKYDELNKQHGNSNHPEVQARKLSQENGVLYQGAQQKPVDKWNSEQLIGDTNFGWKTSRWLNTPEAQREMPAHQMVGRLQNQFPGEWAMFKDMGLMEDLHRKGKVTGRDVDQWLKEKGPKVESARLYPLDKANQIIQEKGGVALIGNKLYQGEQPSVEPPKTKLQPLATATDRAKAHELAAKRNIHLTETDEVIPHPKTTEPVRGFSVPEKRIATLTETATKDTGIHETGHQHFADLRSSKDPKDRAFVQRLNRLTNYNEERIMELTGNRGVEVQNAQLKSWLQDFWSGVKTSVGKGDEQDAVNLFTRRTLQDRPFDESPELWEGVPSKGVDDRKFAVGGGRTTSNSEDKADSAFLEIFKSTVDRIKDKGHAEAAGAYEKFERDNTRLRGDITYPLTRDAKLLKNHDEVSRYIWDSYYGEGSKTKINLADKKIIDTKIHPTLVKAHDIQRAKGPKVDGRNAKDNPDYRGSLMPSNEVIDIVINKPISDKKRQELIDIFIKHQLDRNPEIKTQEQSEQFLEDYLRGFAAARVGSTAQFNAARKAQGFGIPYEWMEKNPVKLFERYGNRMARDIAFHDNIESKPRIRSMFNVLDENNKNPTIGVQAVLGDDIKTAYRRVTGEHTTNETLYNNVEHFFRSMFLGPVTGVKNLTGTVQQILPYVETKDLVQGLTHSIRHIKKGIAEGFEKGVIRDSITALEVGGKEVMGSSFGESLSNLGDIIRKYTGSNFLEQVSRGQTMAFGEFAVPLNFTRAKTGDIGARRFMKKFAPEIDYLKQKSISPEEIKEASARLVERVQGTYDGRGLPPTLLEPSSPLYWAFSLSKWSIEKSNVIKQDVINPALDEGDYGPLMRYLLGGLVTGVVIDTITDAAFGKKKVQPSIREIMSDGEMDDAAVKVAQLWQYAGLAGIMSDIVYQGASRVKGYKGQEVGTLPAFDITKDVAQNVLNASKAVVEGENEFQVALQLANDVIFQNVQALRMLKGLSSHVVENETLERGNKMRDMKTHRHLKDKPVTESPDGVNYYRGLNSRRFKRSETLEEAKEIFEEDIKPSFEGLTPQEKMKKIESLRQNDYATIPEDYKESQEYIAFIKRTQGEEAAKILQEDKRRQDLVNARKKGLVRP